MDITALVLGAFFGFSLASFIWTSYGENKFGEKWYESTPSVDGKVIEK